MPPSAKRRRTSQTPPWLAAHSSAIAEVFSPWPTRSSVAIEMSRPIESPCRNDATASPRQNSTESRPALRRSKTGPAMSINCPGVVAVMRRCRRTSCVGWVKTFWTICGESGVESQQNPGRSDLVSGSQRLVRTDLPNGTFSEVVFDPWQEAHFDPNDTVLDSAWYKDRRGLDPQSDPEGRA